MQSSSALQHMGRRRRRRRRTGSRAPLGLGRCPGVDRLMTSLPIIGSRHWPDPRSKTGFKKSPEIDHMIRFRLIKLGAVAVDSLFSYHLRDWSPTPIPRIALLHRLHRTHQRSSQPPRPPFTVRSPVRSTRIRAAPWSAHQRVARSRTCRRQNSSPRTPLISSASVRSSFRHGLTPSRPLRVRSLPRTTKIGSTSGSVRFSLYFASARSSHGIGSGRRWLPHSAYHDVANQRCWISSRMITNFICTIA